MAGQQQSPVHKKLMMPRAGLQVPSLRLICSRHLSFNEHVQYHQGERLAEQPRVPIYLYSQETFYPRILIALHFVFFKKTKQTTTTTTTTKSLRNSLHVISTVNEGEAPFKFRGTTRDQEKLLLLLLLLLPPRSPKCSQNTKGEAGWYPDTTQKDLFAL